MSYLHIYRLSAETLSEDVEMLIIDEREIEFGYMKASYQFERRCETGKAARKLFPGKLRPRTASNLVRYCSTSSSISESSDLGRRGEQKGGNKGRELTFVANSWFVRKLGERREV
jgi:hypothetical protein